MKRFALALAAALAAAPAAAQATGGHTVHQHGAAQATPYGEPGDPAKLSRAIQIVMKEADGRMVFEPSRIEAKAGEQIQFVLRNAGELEHELVIGTAVDILRHADKMKASPDMAHDEPNARRVAPKKSAALRWRFTNAGEFEYACLIPGHSEAGMIGTIVVK